MNISVINKKRQLLIDIGELAKIDNHTGIQRVVRAISSELIKLNLKEYDLHFIRLSENNNPVYAHNYALEKFGYNDGFDGDEEIYCTGNDILIFIDLNLYGHFHMLNWINQMQEFNTKVFQIVYDLIPINFPEFSFPSAIMLYEEWLLSVSNFDGLICISKSVAKELSEWLESRGRGDTSCKVSWIPLGADMQNSAPSKGLPPDSITFLKKISRNSSFLMVGTVEPRKGHAQVLQGFERLWKSGIDANLLIIGRHGWGMDSFEKKVARHPQNGKHLFRLKHVSDEYLVKLYSASTAVIMASLAEGFGLPCVEAMYYGKQLILRDIPVFREIVGEKGFYFSGISGNDIADAITCWVAQHRRGEMLLPPMNEIPLWHDSVQQLYAIVNNI